MDPLSFIRYLAKLGNTGQRQSRIFVDLPAIEEMDSESCYLGFEVGLTGATTQADIEECF